ncbi:MAG: UDP-N-acetylmuramate--L-alanine ligase [Nitrospirota bacterium]
MFKKVRNIHFIGIGGAGMSGIAEVLLNLGHRVTGSDIKESEVTRRLRELGGGIFIGHRPENVSGAHVVVVSSAIRKENVEVVEARKRAIPIIPRAEMLAELMRLKYSIAVAGAHGKTTTTSMVATVLARGGLDPTVVIGGKLNSLGSNAKLGQGEFLVAEADESDGSFLNLSPTIAVVTTIDKEHIDYYGSMEKIKYAFLSFINKVPFYGLSVLCLDNPYIREIIPEIEKRYISYGLESEASLTAKGVHLEGMGSHFEVLSEGKSLGLFGMTMPGMHNVSNSLAAIAVGIELGIDIEVIKNALIEFSGVERRFQVKGKVEGIIFVDDYGHHPTEIRATLLAAKAGLGRRLVVLFQPHRYTRTRDLLSEFFNAFDQADRVIITDIYPAGENPINGISSSLICEGIKERGHRDVAYISDREAILKDLGENLRSGDIFLTLGAGDVWKIGEELLRLKMEELVR